MDNYAHWQVADSYQVSDRTTLTPGREFTVSGERGATFRFVRHVVNPPHGRYRKPREWIDCVGGTKGVIMTRAFRPERITRVLPERRERRGRARH